MTWIKICGTTSLADAQLAVAAGANALGFIFAESPRRIEPAAAAAIVAKLPGHVEKIGVFVNESAGRIRDIVKQVRLTGVQLHGDESMEYAEALFGAKERPRIYRALSMRNMFSVSSGVMGLRESRTPPPFDAVLVDSGSDVKAGGTGLAFDWTRAQPFIVGLRKRYKVIVAGGLRPDNVAKAIEMFKPWGVDVVSGVEAEPGRKDADKVREFVAAVRQAEK